MSDDGILGKDWRCSGSVWCRPPGDSHLSLLEEKQKVSTIIPVHYKVESTGISVWSLHVLTMSVLGLTTTVQRHAVKLVGVYRVYIGVTWTLGYSLSTNGHKMSLRPTVWL